MSAGEIAHRFAEKAKKIAAKNRLEGWARYQNDGPTPVLPAIKPLVAAFDPAMRGKVAAVAAEALAGHFHALGRSWPERSSSDLFPPELWRLDPATGLLWPGAEEYCFDIAYRHDRQHGDVKYVWEINRLQFLQALAAEAFLTGNVTAVEATEAAITSWFAANPPFRGLAWCSGIEIALRSISLLTVTTLIGERLTPETTAKIRSILAASFRWLERYPSRYSSANNHLIAELSGLHLIALSMPHLPRAARIRAMAERELAHEAGKQFFADGVGAEQSPTYGAFSAEFLLLCNACAPLAPAVKARLDRFADHIFWLVDSRGRVPSIGDNDEGRVLCFDPFGETYAFDVACRIKPAEVPTGIRIFRSGGYTVVRNPVWQIVFDHGPLGYLSIAAHGHADALSFSANIHGTPLLVDPGTYLYHAGHEDRDWYRGTPAHNTLNVQGEDQSCISGPFNWSHRAQCSLDDVAETAPWHVTASHDGYQKRFGVRHRRTLKADGDVLVVEDCLLGSPHVVEIVFQFAPNLELRLEKNVCQVFQADIELATVEFDAAGQITCVEGRVSPAFGLQLAAPRLVWRGKAGEQVICTRISPIMRRHERPNIYE